MINALLLNVHKNYEPRFKDTDLFEQIYYCILMKASGLFRGATIVPTINPLRSAPLETNRQTFLFSISWKGFGKPLVYKLTACTCVMYRLFSCAVTNDFDFFDELHFTQFSEQFINIHRHPTRIQG